MGGTRRTKRTQGKGRKKPAAVTRTAAGRQRDRVLFSAVLAVMLLLMLAGDDRHVGLVADGRQMIRTSVALVETGEIGQARGRDFTLERQGGDAVSRYGMAMSLLEVPAAYLASGIEGRYGAGSSQALFLIVPWLCVGLAAAAAGALARRLGGGNVEVVAAVLLASLASPVGSYAWMEFSEPVQAAALALALLASLAAAAAPNRRRGLELAAGLAAGLAVLTKSSLIVVAPLMLLPLVDFHARARSIRALTRAAVGAAAPLVLWAVFEVVRFGQFFGGYPDDRFTHPWFDGAWRLLVGPNRGLLLFWPALVLFVWAGAVRTGIRPSTPAARAWLAAAAAFVLQVALVAGYWGWHGMEGWGPRLILAAIPLMAPFAAIAPGPRRRPLLVAAVLVCFAINVPPLLQHPTPVATYISNLTWPEVPPSEEGRYPFYATAQSESGQLTVVPFAMVEREPAANPWRLYLWFWRATFLDGQALADRLAQPPWTDTRPDLVPATTWSATVARQIAPRPRVGFLGRSLTGTAGPYATVYLDALLDQVIRANQQGRIDRALELSNRRLRLSADGEAAAWRLESLRRADRGVEAERTLRSLPEAARRNPLINVVLALFDRDTGEVTRARALLSSVAGSFPGTPLDAAQAAPLADWPATLDEMVRVPRRDATVDSRR